MSGPATATSYEESVGSCGPPTPTTAPPPPPAPAASVRRQLDFSGAGDLENEYDDEVLCRLADAIERGYSEAKQRAPACVCGRGVCVVERDDRSGRWKYVCPSRPKCNHVAFYEEVDLNPKSQPTSRNHPEPINPCAFNVPSNHMASPRTPVSVRTRVTDTITPVSVRPQVAGATTLFSDSPQGACATTLVNVGGTATLTNDIPQGVGTTTLTKVIPQGAIATSPAKVSPQGTKSNERPVCQCTAGKCKKSRIGEEDWYVCPIPKGKGACSYRVLVRDFVEDIVPSAQATPCDEIHQEKGHWLRDCPKRPPSDTCFKCGMVGHWKSNCPQL